MRIKPVFVVLGNMFAEFWQLCMLNLKAECLFLHHRVLKGHYVSVPAFVWASMCAWYEGAVWSMELACINCHFTRCWAYSLTTKQMHVFVRHIFSRRYFICIIILCVNLHKFLFFVWYVTNFLYFFVGGRRRECRNTAALVSVSSYSWFQLCSLFTLAGGC